MRIAMGSDHRGYQVKSRLVTLLDGDGHEIVDFGTVNDQTVDYPDFGMQVATEVAAGHAERGILICGNGVGMAIVANKIQGIRAAACVDEVMAEMCRRHNDINILCLPGDLIGDRPVGDMVRIWLATEFEGGRHQRRIDKINAMEHQLMEDCRKQKR